MGGSRYNGNMEVWRARGGFFEYGGGFVDMVGYWEGGGRLGGVGSSVSVRISGGV